MQDQYIRKTASITLDQRYCILDPMDVVSIADPYLFPNAPGNSALFRILEITENDDGTLSINLEELPVAAGAAAVYALNVGRGNVQNHNQPPGPVNAPYIFGMPSALAANQGLSLGVALSGSRMPAWGGCYVYASSDGDSYRLVGRQVGAARMGALTADFPLGSDPDATDTLSVNLSASQGALSAGTTQDADQDNTLCLIAGPYDVPLEFISYSAATLTSAYSYNLGAYIRRGQYGTAITDHPSGSAFARIDGEIFQIPYEADQIGTTIYLKFCSFNIYEGGEESLGSVPAYPVLVPAPPPPPDVEGFTAQQNGNVVVFTWDQLDFPVLSLAGFYIGYAPMGATEWASFRMLTESGAGTEMSNAEVPPGSWTFGIRAASLANVPGTTIGLSPDIATFDLVVTSANDLIYQADEAPSWPAWPGAADGFVRHYTGVLTPAGAKTVDQYAALSPPSPPTMHEVAGGALASTTYYVNVTYVTNTGETLASGGSNILIAANYVMAVADPSGGSPPSTAIGWNSYASLSSGAENLAERHAAPLRHLVHAAQSARFGRAVAAFRQQHRLGRVRSLRARPGIRRQLHHRHDRHRLQRRSPRLRRHRLWPRLRRERGSGIGLRHRHLADGRQRPRCLHALDRGLCRDALFEGAARLQPDRRGPGRLHHRVHAHHRHLAGDGKRREFQRRHRRLDADLPRGLSRAALSAGAQRADPDRRRLLRQRDRRQRDPSHDHDLRQLRRIRRRQRLLDGNRRMRKRDR